MTGQSEAETATEERLQQQDAEPEPAFDTLPPFMKRNPEKASGTSASVNPDRTERNLSSSSSSARAVQGVLVSSSDGTDSLQSAEKEKSESVRAKLRRLEMASADSRLSRHTTLRKAESASVLQGGSSD
jgi:hypothetical protein